MKQQNFQPTHVGMPIGRAQSVSLMTKLLFVEMTKNALMSESKLLFDVENIKHKISLPNLFS